MRTLHIAMATLTLTVVGSLAYLSQILPSHVRAQRPSTLAVHLASSSLPVGKYPLTNDEVQKMILRNDPSEIRAHGWAVLNALVSDDPKGRDGNSGNEASWDLESQPWENKCTLGLGGNNPLCVKQTPATKSDCQLTKPQDLGQYGPILEASIQQRVETNTSGSPTASPNLPSGTPAFISSVRYNSEAADFIRKHCLYSAEGIASLTSAEQFDRHAVIVKLIWNMPDTQQQIPVWNPDFNAVPHSDIPSDPTEWPHVKVDMNDALPCPTNSALQGLSSSIVPSHSSTVPINCFYHRRFPCSFLGIGQNPSTLTPVTYCSNGQKYFDMLLMGVHIITAEQNGWVWNTFWWTPNPDVDPFHRDQPDNIASKMTWRFYAMNIAISRTTPLEKDGTPHVSFNPYLEGPNKNSTSSNCMYCHSMAVIRANSSKQASITAAQEIRSGSPPPCAYQVHVSASCQ